MSTINLHNLSVPEIQTALEEYMWGARLKRIEEYKEQDEKTGSFGYSYGKVCAIPQIEIEGTDYRLSVQASENHYCQPRENVQIRYEQVEIGFPNFNFSKGFINAYAEQPLEPLDTIYDYVPLVELSEELYQLLNSN